MGPVENPSAFNKMTFSEMTVDRKPGCANSVRAEYAGATKAVKNVPARINRKNCAFPWTKLKEIIYRAPLIIDLLRRPEHIRRSVPFHNSIRHETNLVINLN